MYKSLSYPSGRQLLLGVGLLLNALFCVAQNRTATTLSDGWIFKKGAVANAAQPDLHDSDWETVTIPHDWAIKGPFVVHGNGSTGKLPWKGRRLVSKSAGPAGSLCGQASILGL